MTSEFEDEAEQTFTIDEYLEGMEERELEADLVLGGDEGKECTYNNGYMKRQAIFSCLTCTPDGNAGVCTACSLSCHDGHEIIELWTKRNFRCDCGNSKFGEVFCKLNPSKDIENAENSYNHNFKGLYCTCGRPYPDTEAEEQKEMIQCCVCEDWFHEEHLGLQSSDEVPRDEEEEPLYEDFICSTCSEAFSFLRLYPQSKWEAEKKKKHATERKDKEVMEDPDSAGASGKPDSDIPRVSSSESGPSVDHSPAGEAPEKDNGSPVACVLGGADLATVSENSEKKPIFLGKNWRDAICRCGECCEYYKEKGVGFLLGKEDSIAEYEKVAKQKREEKLQQLEGGSLDLLDNLDHVGKMEVLHGIADMKDEIQSFLETFDATKPITSADVRQVFENLAKRRRRV